MKKSFFREYFLYRLKELRGYFIASCVLNLITGPLQITLLTVFQNADGTDNPLFDGYGPLIAITLSCYLLFISIPALILMGVIIPIRTRKSLNRRAYVDTFGALPLTYNQRFFGDLLSELTAYASPALVCGIYTITLIKILESTGEKIDGLVELPQAVVTFFLCCIASTALSTLVVQCCGKSKTGVVFSAMFGVLFSLIVFGGGAIVMSNAIGVDATEAGMIAMGAVPPFGAVINAFQIFDNYDLFFSRTLPTNSLLRLIIFIAITAAYIIAAYFIGKKRKAELVGHGVVFKQAALVFSVAVGAATLGLFLPQFQDLEGESPFRLILTALIATLVVLIIFEVIIYRKSIKPVRLIVKYLCVCAVGFGLWAASYFSHGFGAEDYIPSKDSIREITLYTDNGEFVFEDESAISVLVDEHKSLLKNKEKLKTGGQLSISYKLKSGEIVERGYRAPSERGVFNEYIRKALELPQQGDNKLTALSDESFDLTVLFYRESGSDPENVEVLEWYVKPEKISQFRKILLEDIMADYDGSKGQEIEASQIIPEVLIEANNGLDKNTYYYIIGKSYTNTIEFLSNPDNITSFISHDVGNISRSDIFNLWFEFENGCFRFEYNQERGNPIPNELFELLSEKEEGVEYSEYFSIEHYGDDNIDSLFIRKSDEEKAVEIILSALKSIEFDANYAKNYYNEEVVL